MILDLVRHSAYQKMFLEATAIFDAVGDITIGTTLTSSAGAFLARTNGSIIISDDLTNSGRDITLMANRDCDTGTFSITTATNAEITGGSITLYGADVIIGADLDAGNGAISFIEQCTATTSIGVGSASGYTMNIADAELAFVKTTGKVIFESTLGSIDVSDISQHVQMSQAASAPVEFHTLASSKSITFDTAASTFHTLTCTSAGSIAIEYDLETSSGAMALTSSGSAMALSSGVDLISKGTLTLNGHSVTVATAIFDAVGDITIGTTLTSSAGAFLARTNGSITISNDLTNIGRDITLMANRDCDAGSFSITVDANAEVTGGSITLYGGDIVIGADLDAGAITFIEQCTTTTSVGIGVETGYTMNIADAELGFIKTTGSVTFQSLLGNIDVTGVTQHAHLDQAVSAPVVITASASGKTITFDTSASTFHTLTCSSAGGIAVEYDLQTTSGVMALTSSGSALALSPGVDLISAAALTLNGHSITVVTIIFS